MKKRLLIFSIAAGLSMITTASCGDKGSTPPPEENLVITGNPALLGQQESPGVGPNFPLVITVTSKMPPQGITIKVEAKEEGSTGTAFYTDTKTTSSTVSNFTITNTPKAVSCRITVTATSVSTPGNTVTGFYLYSKK